MSDNPFSDNPFDAPKAELSGKAGLTDRSAALQAVAAPAICLMVLGGLCALSALFGIGNNAFTLAAGSGAAIPDDQAVQDFESQTGISFQQLFGAVGMVGIVLGVVQLLTAGLTAFAGYKLQRLQSYPLVMAGTLLSMLPCVSGCCFLGLPLGIWVLIVIQKPDIKQYFT